MKRLTKLGCLVSVLGCLLAAVSFGVSKYQIAQFQTRVQTIMASVPAGMTRDDANAVVSPYSAQHRVCQYDGERSRYDVYVLRDGEGFMIAVFSRRKEGNLIVESIGTLESYYLDTFSGCPIE